MKFFGKNIRIVFKVGFFCFFKLGVESAKVTAFSTTQIFLDKIIPESIEQTNLYSYQNKPKKYIKTTEVEMKLTDGGCNKNGDCCFFAFFQVLKVVIAPQPAFTYSKSTIKTLE